MLEPARRNKDPVRAVVGDGSGGSISGLAVFDYKGELHRAGEQFRVLPGGVLDVAALGPHAQTGDIDFQVGLCDDLDFRHRTPRGSGYMGAREW